VYFVPSLKAIIIPVLVVWFLPPNAAADTQSKKRQSSIHVDKSAVGMLDYLVSSDYRERVQLRFSVANALHTRLGQVKHGLWMMYKCHQPQNYFEQVVEVKLLQRKQQLMYKVKLVGKPLSCAVYLTEAEVPRELLEEWKQRQAPPDFFEQASVDSKATMQQYCSWERHSHAHACTESACMTSCAIPALRVHA
jgi:hypothetical protein